MSLLIACIADGVWGFVRVSVHMHGLVKLRRQALFFSYHSFQLLAIWPVHHESTSLVSGFRSTETPSSHPETVIISTPAIIPHPTNSPLQRLLLLRIPPLPHLNLQSLPHPHPIHIPLRHILPIRQLAQILQLILRERHPERVFIQHLEALEHELRGRRAGSAFADLVAEAEGLGDGEHGEDGEEGRAFFEGFGDYAASAPGYYAVDPAEDFG